MSDASQKPVSQLGETADPEARRAKSGGKSRSKKKVTQLGDFRLMKKLGQGGMGVVYLGQDPQIGRRVALKTLEPPAGLADAERAQVRQRFFAEAAAVGRLSHPHIVQIYDVGEDRELAYIAMELIEGSESDRCPVASATP